VPLCVALLSHGASKNRIFLSLRVPCARAVVGVQALHHPTNHIFALKCIPKVGGDEDDAIFNEMAMMQVGELTGAAFRLFTRNPRAHTHRTPSATSSRSFTATICTSRRSGS
jgi:hypothetical protein